VNEELLQKTLRLVAYTVYTAAIALVVNVWVLGNLIKK
jgi:hypothetical protein